MKRIRARARHRPSRRRQPVTACAMASRPHEGIPVAGPATGAAAPQQQTMAEAGKMVRRRGCWPAASIRP